jgi:PAS domain S-box-containing protein
MNKILDRIASCTMHIKELAQQAGKGEQGSLTRLSTELEGTAEELQSIEDELRSSCADPAAFETAQMEAVFNAISDAVVIHDAAGRVVRSNPAAVKALGQESSHNLNFRCEDGTPVAASDLPFMQAMTGREVAGVKLFFENAAGEEKAVLASASPLVDDQGKVSGAVSIWRDITELEQTRRQAEEAAKRSQRLVSELNTIFNAMADAVIVFDVNGVAQYANPASVEAYGFDSVSVDRDTRNQYINLRWPSGRQVQPEELPSERSLKGEVIRGERYLQVNGRGEETTILTSSAPLYDPQGQIFGSVVIWHDITILERSERNDHFLADLGQSLLHQTTPEEIYRLATNMLRQHLQGSRCMVYEIRNGQEMALIYEDRPKGMMRVPALIPISMINGEMRESLLRGDPILVEDIKADPRFSGAFSKIHTRVGIRSILSMAREMHGGWGGRLMICDAVPRKWRSDEISLLSSAADLVWLALARARLLTDLRRSQERFDLVLSNSVFTVFTTDRDLRYTWVYNPKHGLTAEALLGRRDDEVLPPEDVSELMRFKQDALNNQVGLRREVRYRVAGQEKVYDLQADLILAVNGTVLGLSGIAMEITERKLLEEEMLKNTAQLEVQRMILQQREMERMQIARDLHDGILQDMVGLGFQLSELVQVNEKEARLDMLANLQANLNFSIRELRAFCSELRPPALAPFGVQKALRSYIQNFQAKHPDLILHTELMPDGRRLTETLRLVVFRVCQELLNNTVKHAQASEIWVHFALDEEGVELQVRDNGRGFSPPRRWVDLVHEGHLGLVGIQERVDAVGGKLEIESVPGQGTRVRVLIPTQNNPKIEGSLKI